MTTLTREIKLINGTKNYVNAVNTNKVAGVLNTLPIPGTYRNIGMTKVNLTIIPTQIVTSKNQKRLIKDTFFLVYFCYS